MWVHTSNVMEVVRDMRTPWICQVWRPIDHWRWWNISSLEERKGKPGKIIAPSDCAHRHTLISCASQVHSGPMLACTPWCFCSDRRTDNESLQVSISSITGAGFTISQKTWKIELGGHDPNLMFCNWAKTTSSPPLLVSAYHLRSANARAAWRAVLPSE